MKNNQLWLKISLLAGAIALGLGNAYFFPWPLLLLGLALTFFVFWRWTEFSFFALVAYLPFQIALNPTVGIDLASGRLLILLLFLIVMVKKNKREKEGWKNRNNLVVTGLAMFFLVSFFSILSAGNPAWGWRKEMFLASIFPIFFLSMMFIRNRAAARRLAWVILSSSVASALVALAQFLAQFFWGYKAIFSFWAKNIAPLFWGRNFGEAVVLDPSWLVNAGGRTIMRAIGLFPDPHMLAFCLGLSLPASIALILIENKYRPLIFGFFCLNFLVLLLTFSRGGYLGAAVSLVFLAIFFWKKMALGSKKFFVSLVLLLLVVFIIFGTPILARFWSSFDFSEGSAQGRLAIWRESVAIFEQSPLLGVGLGNYAYAVNFAENYRNSITAHNLYLDLLVETGIFGLLAWLFFLTGIFIEAFKKIKNVDKADYFLLIGFLGSAVYFASHSFFETAMFNPANFAIFMVVAGAVAGIKFLSPPLKGGDLPTGRQVKRGLSESA